MRKTFIDTLTKLAEKDPTVVLVVGDVGFSFVEEFQKKFPKQFINCGIMEQTMLGACAGLANMGMKPYCYTMKNFILLRPLEQLRNDIAYANANVKLFGVGGSEAYKFLGFSHNMTEAEEFGIIENLPNMALCKALKPNDLEEFINEEYERIGPSYTIL